MVTTRYPGLVLFLVLLSTLYTWFRVKFSLFHLPIQVLEEARHDRPGGQDLRREEDQGQPTSPRFAAFVHEAILGHVCRQVPHVTSPLFRRILRLQRGRKEEQQC